MLFARLIFSAHPMHLVLADNWIQGIGFEISVGPIFQQFYFGFQDSEMEMIDI